MTRQRLHQLKLLLRPLWAWSPERLWLLSIALHRRGHWILAFALKQLNGFLYHNSLAPGATVSPDIFLGHNSLGIVINRNVEIGSGVTIWQNVTLAAGRVERAREQGRIIIEDGVKIGANAVVMAPRGGTLRIGRGARVGAGTVVTQDVHAGTVIVSAEPRTFARKRRAGAKDETLGASGEPLASRDER